MVKIVKLVPNAEGELVAESKDVDTEVRALEATQGKGVYEVLQDAYNEYMDARKGNRPANWEEIQENFMYLANLGFLHAINLGLHLAETGVQQALDEKGSGEADEHTDA